MGVAAGWKDFDAASVDASLVNDFVRLWAGVNANLLAHAGWHVAKSLDRSEKLDSAIKTVMTRGDQLYSAGIFPVLFFLKASAPWTRQGLMMSGKRSKA